jgi:hypothetical protein
MQKRGNDALDIFDVGVTVSGKPGFSLYAGFLNIAALGYSHVDGTFLGIAGRDTGVMPVRNRAAGLFLWGREHFEYKDFDPAVEDMSKRYCVGLIGLIQGPGPRGRDVVNCPKLLHLGWVGITLNCHFAELADFLLGWTTLDFRGDDVPVEAASAAPAPAGKP